MRNPNFTTISKPYLTHKNSKLGFVKKSRGPRKAGPARMRRKISINRRLMRKKQLDPASWGRRQEKNIGAVKLALTAG